MASPKRAGTSPEHAMSVAGPTVGWCDATTSTSEENIDLADWAGRYVQIQCETSDHYVAFVDASGTTMTTGAAAIGTAAVPLSVFAGTEGVHRVVPPDATILKYRTVSGTGVLRVIPS